MHSTNNLNPGEVDVTYALPHYYNKCITNESTILNNR